MRVRFKSDRFYRAFADPWGIGDAVTPRYDRYRELVLEHATGRGRLLDIGCGYAAFLARFRGEFDELYGVDIGAVAISGARARHRDITFAIGSAAAPPAELGKRDYDVIVQSDVICYLPDRKRRAAISWIADHLTPHGIALIAAWVPGGRYLTDDELTRLVDARLVIEHHELLDSGHLVMIARPRRAAVVLSIDYETWQPIPEGRSIEWEDDVLAPTAALLRAAAESRVPLTFMVEMAEYFWLCQNDPAVAAQMRDQWREAARAGHDVQLHLHPNWLPELGADRDNGRWRWDPEVALAADYPGDLTALIERCRRELERVISPVRPGYRVNAFRAGTYEAQPFERLHRALVENGVNLDSSVLPGDHRDDRQYDYRHASALSGAWPANRFDPQLRAADGDRDGLLEACVTAVAPGSRWTFDADEGSRFVDRLQHVRTALAKTRTGSTELYRVRRSLAARLVGPAWGPISPILRRVVVPRHRPAGDDIFVLVGHTKNDLAVPSIARGLARLAADRSLECVTMSTAAELAHRRPASVALRPEPEPQRHACGRALARLVPLDRVSIAVLSAGVENYRAELPWAQISTELQPDGSDAVLLDCGLESESDPDKALTAAARGLRSDGVLLCRAWADGRAGWRAPATSTYAPTRSELGARLQAAGFGDVEVREVDATRMLGLPYRPEAEGRILLVRAWIAERKRSARMRALVDAIYARLDPERASASADPLRILADGSAWCAGYAAVLAEALQREGYPSRRVTLVAHGHPRGRGRERRETHEVVEAWDGTALRVLDPMAGVVFDHSLRALLDEPALARPNRVPDQRWEERHYELYATELFYRRVVGADLRKDPAWPPRTVAAADVLADIPDDRGIPHVDRSPLHPTLLRLWWGWHDSRARTWARGLRRDSNSEPPAERSIATSRRDQIPTGAPAEPLEHSWPAQRGVEPARAD